MDNSFSRHGSDTQRPRNLFAGLQIISRIPNWLARLVQLMRLTEAEQRDAGIHLRQRTKEEMGADIRPDHQRDD